jgi:hypothetical protein
MIAGSSWIRISAHSSSGERFVVIRAPLPFFFRRRRCP